MERQLNDKSKKVNMTNVQRSKIEDFGAIFRFLTPILITIIGYITLHYLADINKRFEKIDNKFDVFIETYHIIDKRIDRLEYKVFGERVEQYSSIADE